jgi:hypothetical protein
MIKDEDQKGHLDPRLFVKSKETKLDSLIYITQFRNLFSLQGISNTRGPAESDQREGELGLKPWHSV